MATPSDPIAILTNGITSILDRINSLIPVFNTTTNNLDTTAQAVTQLASVAAQTPTVHVEVNQNIVPLPEEYK
ncbi:hypothetical protein H0H81_007269, partial [Sphagnurus paluster]